MLTGKTAIVTGGSDGIGRAIATTFAAEGANVLICARNEEKLMATKAQIEANGGTCEAVSLDLSGAQAYADFVEATAQKGLDILVNNAPHVGYGMLADTSLEDFRQNFLINVDFIFKL